MTRLARRTIVRVLSGERSGEYGTVTEVLPGPGPEYVRVLLADGTFTAGHWSNFAVFTRQPSYEL